MARLLWTLVLAGRMVDYAPLSGLGLSDRAVDTAECTINSPLLFINPINLFIFVLLFTNEVVSVLVLNFCLSFATNILT